MSQAQLERFKNVFVCQKHQVKCMATLVVLEVIIGTFRLEQECDIEYDHDFRNFKPITFPKSPRSPWRKESQTSYSKAHPQKSYSYSSWKSFSGLNVPISRMCSNKIFREPFGLPTMSTRVPGPQGWSPPPPPKKKYI